MNSGWLSQRKKGDSIKVRSTDSICHRSNQAEMMHHNLSKLMIFIVYFRYAMNCRLRRQENREKLETQVRF